MLLGLSVPMPDRVANEPFVEATFKAAIFPLPR
jgi:hypothetical protein